jgi:hypothetical protein
MSALYSNLLLSWYNVDALELKSVFTMRIEMTRVQEDYGFRCCAQLMAWVLFNYLEQMLLYHTALFLTCRQCAAFVNYSTSRRLTNTIYLDIL